MQISFSAPALPDAGALVVFATDPLLLTDQAQTVDKATNGALTRAAKVNRFAGKSGESVTLFNPDGLDAERLVLLGLGAADKLDRAALEAAGANITKQLLSSGTTKVTVLVDKMDCGLDEADQAVALAAGLLLRSYRFDKYRTKEPKSKKPTLESAHIGTMAHSEADTRFAREKAVISGVFLTRDLISEPANIIHPESFADLISGLESDGLEITILGEKEMTELGMGALLGVGQGSARESKLAIMHWKGGNETDKPLAFVGKGVTFDTGGISIKPAAGMEQMKWDMGGAGIVVGLMKALAARKAKVNAVGVVGLVENMPSSTAQRPGDVVTSLSGQTIEVLNTDAEGRLVLADALWYTQKNFAPELMIDLATLTGAIIISLGHEYAGYFTDKDDLAGQLYEAGTNSGDKVWRMPIADGYDKLLDCDIADMKNIGGRAAGSITAAQFLKRFTNGVPWAHIDVAGMVWSDKDGTLHEKGATGFGVRLLDRFIARSYESA
jgi:leucyl aminopeptidase